MGKRVKKGRAPPKVKPHTPKTASHQGKLITASVYAIVKERNPCIHLDKVNFETLLSKITSSKVVRCEDCREGANDRRGNKGKGKHAKKKGSESKSIWVCLECGHFTCGGVGFPTSPENHAIRHFRQDRHSLFIKWENPSLRWCFSCNSLIPVEKVEDNGESKDVLSDVVKLFKAHSSESSVAAYVEEVRFGSGSILSEVKSECTVTVITGSGYVVRGLVNLGNTCFFNSIMQNLLAMERLRDYFLNHDVFDGPLTNSLKNLYIETKPESGLKNVINPRSVFGSLCTKAPQFRGYQQHDSHELLRCLLDELHTEESSARKQIKRSEEKDGTSSSLDSIFVDVVFGGQISSTVRCVECGHHSTVYEPFLDLSLPVPTKRPTPKKAQPIARAKKTKLPPKRTGRVRPKPNKDADLLPAQSISNTCVSNKSRDVAEISETPTEKTPATSNDSENADSGVPTTMTSENASVTQSTSAPPEQVDDFTWMDYFEPVTISAAEDSRDIDHVLDDAANNASNEDNKMNEKQDSILSEEESPIQVRDSEVLYRPYNKESSISGQIIKSGADEMIRENASVTQSASALPEQVNDFTWMDYFEPVTISAAEDSRDIDHVLDDAANNASNEDNKMNEKQDSILSEEESPIQVRDSEVLYLPYNKESSISGQIIKSGAEASSSASGWGQDEDIGGFGDLFNEPEVELGPLPRPSSGSGVTGTGFSSESDPCEVDDIDFPVSVDSCLAHFVKPEFLSNENAWECENCTEFMQKSKRDSKTSSVLTNGGPTRSQSDSQIFKKEISCPRKVMVATASNVEISSSVISDNLVESAHLRNGKIEDGMIMENKPEMSEELEEQSQSCDFNEPNTAGCSTDKLQQTDSLSSVNCESEENENEEINSKSIKVKRDATKMVFINKAPPILTIHLKRFSQDTRGRLSKLNGHVSFREIIDLKPYMDTSRIDQEEYVYRLVGVVEHLGSMRGGHYVAYIRGGAKSGEKANIDNGASTWYHASDSYVREVSLEEVFRSEAYILFYEKI